MKVRRVSSLAGHRDPQHAAWQAITHDDIALMPTPLAMQPTEYIRKSWEGKRWGEVASIRLACVHDGATFAAHLTCQGVSPPGGDFPDAVALALPISGKPVLMLMGSPDAPIHMLRWQADKPGVRSIVATGIGQSRPGAEMKCSAQAKADGDIWSVVITRPLGHGKDVAPLAAGSKTGIGFAVWHGGNDERAGMKAFSLDWTELVLDA